MAIGPQQQQQQHSWQAGSGTQATTQVALLAVAAIAAAAIGSAAAWGWRSAQCAKQQPQGASLETPGEAAGSGLRCNSATKRCWQWLAVALDGTSGARLSEAEEHAAKSPKRRRQQQGEAGIRAAALGAVIRRAATRRGFAGRQHRAPPQVLPARSHSPALGAPSC